MSETRKRRMPGWLLGCTVGCGAIVAGGLVLLGAGAVWGTRMYRQFDRAIADRATLDERFGRQEEYVPAADGSIPADRMEAFLAVRDALGPYCPEFERTFGVFDRVEAQGDKGSAPSAGDILEVVRTAFGMGPLVGRFSAARNGALLAQEMGMGEYVYIYVIAYGPNLAQAPPRRHRGSVEASRHVRSAVRAMLQAQRTAAVTAAPELVDRLGAEIAALSSDPARLPWQDGLPPTIAAAVGPFRARLDEAFCPAAADFDLARNRKHGLAIQAD